MKTRTPVHIVTDCLFSPDGSRLLTGGAERWCRDLALLLNRAGYLATVYQRAGTAFRTSIDGRVDVLGIPCAQSTAGIPQFWRRLKRNANPEEAFLFVSAHLGLPAAFTRGIGVNHGIWWDGDFPRWKRFTIRRVQMRLLNHLAAIICVDTSFINWCHTELPNRRDWMAKLHFIPNYADTEIFSRHARTSSGSEPIRLLFPRRLTGQDLEHNGRGAGLFLRAAQLLMADGVNLHLTFAGRGDLKEAIMRFASDNGFRAQVDIIEAPLDGMREVYAAADVVVVPSVEHEGTSLAAIEAMCCGKPVVVTHIGGLANIVLDGLNGHVADLTPTSVAGAIQRAIAAEQLPEATLARLRCALSKTRWEAAVLNCLTQALNL